MATEELKSEKKGWEKGCSSPRTSVDNCNEINRYERCTSMNWIEWHRCIRQTIGDDLMDPHDLLMIQCNSSGLMLFVIFSSICILWKKKIEFDYYYCLFSSEMYWNIVDLEFFLFQFSRSQFDNCQNRYSSRLIIQPFCMIANIYQQMCYEMNVCIELCFLQFSWVKILHIIWMISMNGFICENLISLSYDL